MVDGLDDDTTLLIFGDHGLTPDGNHGGETTFEMASGFFAFQKTPFPMYETYQRNKDIFGEMDNLMRLGDITAITSMLIDCPFPFSNMGKMHPLLAPSDDIRVVYKKFLDNIK